MFSFEMAAGWDMEQSALRADLLASVEMQTRGQIRDLDLDCRGDLVVVTGGCESPALKKLVTRAIRAAEPRLRLQNKIRICA